MYITASHSDFSYSVSHTNKNTNKGVVSCSVSVLGCGSCSACVGGLHKEGQWGETSSSRYLLMELIKIKTKFKNHVPSKGLGMTAHPPPSSPTQACYVMWRPCCSRIETCSTEIVSHLCWVCMVVSVVTMRWHDPVTHPSPAQTGTGKVTGKKFTPIPVPMAPVPVYPCGNLFPCPSLCSDIGHICSSL